MVYDSSSALLLVRRKCVPAVQVTQSTAAMSDTDFHKLHRKYCNSNVANAGKPEDCGQRNGAKTPDTTKSPKHNTGMPSKPSPKEKFGFGKGWRNRPKVIANAGNALWAPESKENYVWSSVGGRKVCLGSFDICDLTEPERLALQQVALSKLRKLNLRSHVTIPKSSRSDKRTSSLKRALSLKSKLAMGSSDNKESAVFAVPLRKAVAQSTPENMDKKMKKGSQEESLDGRSDEQEAPRVRRHSASSLNQQFSKSTLDEGSQQKENVSREPPGSPNWKSRLIDALTLNSSSASATCIIDNRSMMMPQPPRVPPIVTQAIEHLETYGLHVLGIFRTGGSKRRMKQMREQFDSGEKTKFTAEDNPHDVAALFKEYFRDLPEPLLTRDLYAAFLESQGIDDQSQKKTMLQLLCCLLPPPNRDTLKALLEFLSKVDYYAEDRVDEKAIEIPGNKMNSHNLATLIGPNILHKVKAGHNHDYAVDDPARAEELKETIDVVKDLILGWKELFVISADLYHEIYQHLLENEPEILDYLLRKKTPIRISGAESDEVLEAECVTSNKPEPHRVRCRSAGDSDRPIGVIRTASAPNTRPPPDYHQHRQRNHGYTIKSKHHVNHTRSQSLNREEGDAFRGRLFARQLSSPTESNYNGAIRARQRTPPPPSREHYRLGSLSPEPSPSLSSSFSHSTYSTPPSSPPLTPYFSAESTCSSPVVSVSYLGSEGPAVTELEELLFEVEKDLAKDHTGDLFKNNGNTNLEHDVPDWQLERWIKWESLAHRRSSPRDALEQETLV